VAELEEEPDMVHSVEETVDLEAVEQRGQAGRLVAQEILLTQVQPLQDYKVTTEEPAVKDLDNPLLAVAAVELVHKAKIKSQDPQVEVMEELEDLQQLVETV
jgi:hypothetical protein